MNGKKMQMVKEMERTNGTGKDGVDNRSCHNRRDAENVYMRKNPRRYYKALIKNKKGVI